MFFSLSLLVWIILQKILHYFKGAAPLGLDFEPLEHGKTQQGIDQSDHCLSPNQVSYVAQTAARDNQPGGGDASGQRYYLGDGLHPGGQRFYAQVGAGEQEQQEKD